MTALDTGADIVPLGYGRHAGARGHGAGGPASKRIVVGYGFWIFLLSDFVMFSCFFAAYAVLAGATAGGPAARQIFHPDSVAIETACLLLSSFVCGLATLAVARESQLWTQVALLVSGLLRICFRSAGSARIRNAGGRRKWPDAKRLPECIFYAGRLSRIACLARPVVARDDDGAVFRQGISPQHPLPVSLLQPVLARARHHLGRDLFAGLSRGDCPVSMHTDAPAGSTAR